MSALTQMTGYGLPQMALPQMALPSMSMPKLSMPGDAQYADPEKWYSSLSSAVASEYPQYSGTKYVPRFDKYLDTLESTIGSDITGLAPLYMPKKANDAGGPVFRVKMVNGKEYVVEVPHSPGGMFFDFATSPKQGWGSLGLGDLGGEGNEKIPGNSGASYIPLEKFKGFGENSAIYMKNVNPKGASLGDSLGGLLGAGLGFALGPAGFAMMPGWAAGAIGGGLGSAISGGDPLKGALFGGLGAGLGGEIGNLFSDMPGMGFIGSDFMGPLSPMESIMKGAIGGAIPGAIRGAFSGNPMMGALQGGFAGGAGTAIQGFDPTGLPALDSAIERGLIGVGSAGLFGGDMEGALLGGALNAGFAGAGEQLGLPSALTGNVSSMVNKIIRSNMSEQQKRDAIKKIQQQQQMRGMLTNRRMAS